MTTQFDTVREALNILRGAVGHEENIHTADIALAALAELERTHYTAEDVADASAQGFRDGVASVTAGLEPVAWQRRMRPTWGSHAAYPWSPWEPCTKEQADDHWKTPLLHEWAYEARALYTAAPVAQQPQEIEVQCPVCNHKFHEWPNDKQPQAEAVPEKEDFCYCNDEISLQIVSGGAAPEGLYGRVTLKVNGEYVGYVKDVAHQSEQTPTARYIGDLAGIVDAARKEPLEQIVSLCETIRYMVGIAERGSGEKCPDDMAPEVFLLRYVQRLEAALEFVARHKSSDWPERCQQMVDAARSTLAEPQQAEAVPSDVSTHRHAWRTALAIAQLSAKTPDDADYWAHEIRAFERTFDALAALATPQQAEAVPVVDRVYEAAKRLVDHADFQLGGVLSAKSKARDIPSNAASKVKARHLASLRDALAKAPQQAEAVPGHTLPYERALAELIEKIVPGLDSGDVLADAATASAALTAPQQAEAVPLFGEGHIEAAAKKMAEIFDYPWDFMPEKGRNTMRENVRAVLAAALAAAPKGQP